VSNGAFEAMKTSSMKWVNTSPLVAPNLMCSGGSHIRMVD